MTLFRMTSLKNVFHFYLIFFNRKRRTSQQRRRIGKRIRRIALQNFVFAHHIDQTGNLRSRFNSVRINFIQLFNIIQNSRKLGLKFGDLGFGQPKPCQCRHMLHLFFGKFHEESLAEKSAWRHEEQKFRIIILASTSKWL